VLGIITLIVLGSHVAEEYTQLYGGCRSYIETVTTGDFLFTCSASPRPDPIALGAPLLPNAEAPALQVASAVMGVCSLIGAALQVRACAARLGRPAT